MQCSKCGYHMHGSETMCVCCGQQHSNLANLTFPMTPARIACPSCGLMQDVGSRFCRSCGINPSFSMKDLPRRWLDGTKAAMVIAALVVLILGGGIWGVVTQQDEARANAEAQRIAQAREARLDLVLTRLRSARPAAAFDRYPGDNNSLPLKARLTTCDVRGITFSRTDGSDTLSVNVSLTGYKADHQAPTVNVALYAENGDLLAQKAIVEFANAELEQGETREVEDDMDYPKTGTPVFVGVNEGPADSFASPPPDFSQPVAAEPAMTDAQRATDNVKAAQERWKQDAVQGEENGVGAIAPAPRPYTAVMADYKRAMAPDMLVEWPYGSEGTMGMTITEQAFAQNLPQLSGQAEQDGVSLYTESKIADADFAKSMALAFMSKRMDAGFKVLEAANCRVIVLDQHTGASFSATPDLSDPKLSALVEQANASGH